ncbi:BLUF domain-containing protein [Gilvimarinus algae]|uniref:BLUF domain-containing protein n=1 Tax=Gilvimarinus algae TaxID=3058037 RepID=A0ABT8TC62_9GAMM|nr:BLUF domain-containing protein [Gilvimarinus sp. SDUM040014]MDO3381235.1 BLUF domain-containing protein [Gilvimarinus sp. SDUM040014]
MKAILYVSRATEAFGDGALGDLLQQAEARNLELGVTGYLFYKAPYFFQYIESEGDEVTELMQSITRDSRHEVINQVEDEFTGARRFPRWSMQFVNDKVLNRISLEQIVIDDLLSMTDVYRDEGRWRQTLFQLVGTISRNQQTLASQPRG